MKINTLIKTGLCCLSLCAFAGPAANQWVLTDVSQLQDAKIKAVFEDAGTGLAVAKVSSMQESVISKNSHQNGRCAGYEYLGEKEITSADFQKFVKQVQARKTLDAKAKVIAKFSARSAVTSAIADVNADKIKEWVTWLASYPTRYHKGPTPNAHVEALQTKLDDILKNYSSLGANTSLITHTNTKQKSLRLRIPGKTKPDEIVVMGAHLDSVKMSFIGLPSAGRAPGADDDASGSASLLESLDHLLAMAPFDRTVEVFWYAGEEGGLLGSSEIADAYKKDNKKVVGVMQLDMTLYPGSGDGTIASMTDFTSPEMRDLMTELNTAYLGITIVEDKCGYGCSDHAPWYRNGYPTLMPTEATFKQMNHNIHTSDDDIDSGSSFEHAAIFSKLAIAYVSHLASP